MLRPFFTYYGGKWRAAPRYPQPQHETLIEPFAGAAGYSLRNPDKRVRLYDADPIIAGLWQYLIRVSASEIRGLPLLGPQGTLDDLKGLPQEAEWLIGFWLNKGAARPCRSPSAWMRAGTHANSFWGERVRERIASQVEHIRHWRAFNLSYSEIPNEKATWFIDPPYQKAGKHYACGSAGIDFSALGKWCRSREGAVVVCENAGADWLPFVPFMEIKATAGSRRKGVSKEVVYARHE